MFRPTFILAAVITSVILGVPSRGQNGKTSAAITGTVTYRQRSALPSDAIVNLQLQDIFLQDAPAKLIAEVNIPTKGKQVPIGFSIPYTLADIDPVHTYAVEATILVNRRMLFTSTTSYPVITHGAPTEISIIVEPVAAEAASNTNKTHHTHTARAKLEGTDWKLIELGGAPFVVTLGTGSADLQLNPEGKKVAGSGGCNRFMGTYEAGKGSLHFSAIALTEMACPEPAMKQEHDFVEALQATTRYRIVGETLEMRNGKRVLVRLQSQSAE
jgi:putative lipoprotein